MTKKPYTYNQLNILNTVLEEGSYSNAALTLGMSQSAVSQAMARLENSLNIKLFTQSGRHLIPTDYCLEIGDKTSKMLQIEQELNELIRTSKIFESSVLKVGLCNAMPGTEILRKFNELFPKLQIEVYFGNFEETYNRVVNQEVDVGILANVANDSRLKLKTCATQRLVALCSPQHPLASKSSISLKQLNGENIIFRTKGSATQKLVNEALAKINVSLTPAYKVNNQQSVLDTVRQNLGVGFAWSKSAISEEGLVKIPIEEFNRSYDEVIFCLKSSNNQVVATLMNSVDNLV